MIRFYYENLFDDEIKKFKTGQCPIKVENTLQSIF